MDGKIDAIARAFDEAWGRSDLDGLLELFAQDAVIESPLIPKILGKGMVRGPGEIRILFERMLDRGIRFGRHDPVAVRDSMLFVEYRRQTPQGEQRDAVDVFEVEGGKVKSLRVYWGWKTVGEMTGQAPGRVSAQS